MFNIESAALTHPMSIVYIDLSRFKQHCNGHVWNMTASVVNNQVRENIYYAMRLSGLIR